MEILKCQEPDHSELQTPFSLHQILYKLNLETTHSALAYN